MKFERVQMNQGEGSGSFLKIEDNGSVNGILRGEVLKFYQHWPKGAPATEKKVFDKPTSGASARFKVNFIVHEEGKFVAKIWEFSPTVSNQLADIAEAYDLTQTKIKISKHVAKKTTYAILPLAGEKDKLTAKHLKEIAAVELNPLTISPTDAGPKEPLKNYAPGADDDSEIPF